MDTLHLQLRLYLAQLLERRHICLGGGPEGSQVRHPTFGFEPLHDAQRVLLMEDFLGLIAALSL